MGDLSFRKVPNTYEFQEDSPFGGGGGLAGGTGNDDTEKRIGFAVKCLIGDPKSHQNECTSRTTMMESNDLNTRVVYI